MGHVPLSSYVVCGHFRAFLHVPLIAQLLYQNKKFKRFQKWKFKFRNIQNKKGKMRADRIEWSCDTTFIERKCLIFHEQYNTGHEVSAIPDEVRRKIWGKQCEPEIQQEPLIHLFLEGPLGRQCGIAGLSVQAPPQSSESAYGGRTETHPPLYAPS